MKNSTKIFNSISQTADYFLTTVSKKEVYNQLELENRLKKGEKTQEPILIINYLYDPADSSNILSTEPENQINIADPLEAELSAQIVSFLKPTLLHNPFRPSFRLGCGTGTLLPAFGITLNPELGNVPAGFKSIDELLAMPEPDPVKSGLGPGMREQIDFIRHNLDNYFKIQLPDMQGPFNLAHSMLGENAFIIPLEQPEKFHQLLERIVTYWISLREMLITNIGPQYLDPLYSNRICECSVNLVSSGFYLEHILPHDLKIAGTTGPIHLHHCSGPHVIETVYTHVPVSSVEAGYIEKTAAGSASVEKVLALTAAEKPPVHIGEELPEDFETAKKIILHHFELCRERPESTFAYTGMSWRGRDASRIFTLHEECSRYWNRHWNM